MGLQHFHSQLYPGVALLITLNPQGVPCPVQDNPLVDLPRVHFEDDDSESAPAASNVRKFASIDYRARAPSVRPLHMHVKRVNLNTGPHDLIQRCSSLGSTTRLVSCSAEHLIIPPGPLLRPELAGAARGPQAPCALPSATFRQACVLTLVQLHSPISQAVLDVPAAEASEQAHLR